MNPHTVLDQRPRPASRPGGVDGLIEELFLAAHVPADLTPDCIPSVGAPVTPRQFDLLVLLHRDEPQRLNDMAYGGFNPSSAARMLTRLAVAGLITPHQIPFRDSVNVPEQRSLASGALHRPIPQEVVSCPTLPSARTHLRADHCRMRTVPPGCPACWG